MDEKAYREHKQHLQEHLESATALIQAAYQVELQALEIVKSGSSLHVDLPVAASKAPPKPPAAQAGDSGKTPDRKRKRTGKRPGKRKRYGGLQKDLGRTVKSLGNEFSTNEVMEGMPPAAKRGSVRAALNRLVASGELARTGDGQFAKPGTPEAQLRGVQK